MEMAQRLAEKPHCVNFRVFDGQVALPEELVEALAAEKQQQQETLVAIEMRKLITLTTCLPLASACWSTAR